MATAGQSRQQKKAFLDAFAEQGNVRSACSSLGIPRSTVYFWRDRDERFRDAFAEAEIEATESLEAEAYRRAVTGTVKPVYQGGERVGEILEFSDTLLIFLLKGRAPEKYRDNAKIEHVGSDGGPIQIKPIDYRSAVAPLLTDGE